jgi:hypothetical protein
MIQQSKSKLFMWQRFPYQVNEKLSDEESKEKKKEKEQELVDIEKYDAKVEAGHSYDLNASPSGRTMEKRINEQEPADDDHNAPEDTG